MDSKKTAQFVSNMWDSEIIPQISEYIRVPNKSPHFDPDWEKHGHMEKAVAMLEAWCRSQPVKGMTVEVV
ncbi:MAG: peptidase M20, partial [Gammaproteobacteria bacterium]|nr:peptidase M20 [Gammaproteobacteria bacterium]